MKYYYPSCKFKMRFVAISERINEYLNKKSVNTIGCCRKDFLKLNEIDKGITVCTNCSLILKEVTGAHICSLWEIIDKDEDFILPHLRDSSFVIQHCAKADESFKTAVCSLMNKMEATYTISSIDDYCGFNFTKHMSQANLQIAPKAFSNLEKKVVLLDEKQKKEKINAIIESYHGHKVIVYCNSCYEALKENGADVIHIAELLFGA